MGTVDDDRNVGTLVAPLDSLDRHHLDALSLYRRARAKVLELRRSASQLHGGFWVFHAGGPVQPVGFVPAVAGTHAILGRHDCVDLRVPEHHTGFSLRQALLRARRVDGRLVLNLMDLESPQGIRLGGVHTVRALEAVGPFTASMGGLTMLFVPEDPKEDLPGARPVPEIRCMQSRSQAPPPRRWDLPLPNPPEAEVALSHARSRVNELVGLQRVDAGSIIPALPYAQSYVGVDLDAARAQGACAFHLTCHDRVLGTLVLTREQLEAGVLLGRYDRCFDLGSQRLDTQVSRVHALFILERGALRVFDLGSTNGVVVDDQAVRSATLVRHQIVELSTELTLRVLFTSVPTLPPPPPPPERL